MAVNARIVRILHAGMLKSSCQDDPMRISVQVVDMMDESQYITIIEYTGLTAKSGSTQYVQYESYLLGEWKSHKFENSSNRAHVVNRMTMVNASMASAQLRHVVNRMTMVMDIEARQTLHGAHQETGLVASCWSCSRRCGAGPT